MKSMEQWGKQNTQLKTEISRCLLLKPSPDLLQQIVYAHTQHWGYQSSKVCISSTWTGIIDSDCDDTLQHLTDAFILIEARFWPNTIQAPCSRVQRWQSSSSRVWASDQITSLHVQQKLRYREELGGNGEEILGQIMCDKFYFRPVE